MLRHVILQSSIRVEGDQRLGPHAVARDGQPRPRGHDEDGHLRHLRGRVRQVDGHWLIAERNVLNEFIPRRNSGRATRSLEWMRWPRRRRSGYASDRAEIDDLMARYLFAMDYHDADAYAECFTEDGSSTGRWASPKGREAIRAEALSFKEQIGEIFKDSEGRPAKLRHVVAQKAIRVDGDRAWNTGLWFEMTNGGPDGSIGPAELRHLRGRAGPGRRTLAVHAAQDLQRVPARARIRPGQSGAGDGWGAIGKHHPLALAGG